MKQHHFLQRIPENAVFWLLLFFLAAGSATSLYGKITGRTETVDSGRILSPVTVISARSAASSLTPISHVQTPLSCAALTFDLNGSKGSLDLLLDTLDAGEAKATFFLSRQWMEEYPAEVRSIAERGHELGIQAGTAVNYRNLSVSEIKKELNALHTLLTELSGKEPTCFRPPYGDEKNPSASAAAKLGYTVVTGDCDSLDWKDYGADAVYTQIMEKCRPQKGSILLFHGNARYTADALAQVIAGLKEAGLSPVSISGLYPEN